MRHPYRAIARVACVALLCSVSSGLAIAEPDTQQGTILHSDDPEIPGTDPGGQPYDHQAAIAEDDVIRLIDHYESRVGFTNVSLRVDYGLDLRWSGPPPGDLEKVLEALEIDRQVQVEAWPFSRNDLQEAASTMLQMPEVIGTGLAMDDSGLIVYVSNPRLDAEWIEKSAKELGVGVPVKLRVVDDLVFARQNDQGSLEGGAQIGVPQEGGGVMRCTSGVAAIDDATGVRGMLTAWHCKNGPRNGQVNNSAGQFRGNFEIWSQGRDVAYFTGYGTGYASWIYSGAWNAPQSGRRGVSASTVGLYNTAYCMSGSRSGELCGIYLSSFDAQITLDGRNYDHLMVGEKSGYTILGGQGDSGGPLVRWFWHTGSSRWYARPLGLFTAISDTQLTQCPGDPNATGSCGRVGWYSNLRSAENLLNLTVVDGVNP